MTQYRQFLTCFYTFYSTRQFYSCYFSKLPTIQIPLAANSCAVSPLTSIERSLTRMSYSSLQTTSGSSLLVFYKSWVGCYTIYYFGCQSILYISSDSCIQKYLHLNSPIRVSIYRVKTVQNVISNPTLVIFILRIIANSEATILRLFYFRVKYRGWFFYFS